MARNAASVPSDMPELNSDSDTSDSDEDAPNQRWQPPPSRNSGRAAAFSAARPAARSDGPAVRNPANSMPNPNSSEREAQPGAIPRGGKGNVAPVSQQQNSHVPIPSSAPTSQSSNSSAFCHGNCVRITGLQSRADLNGCPGYVSDEMDKSSGRWPVIVVKGAGRDVETVKLRGVNMAIIKDLDACDPGHTAEIPTELRETNAADPQILAKKIRDHKRRWHRAALHLIGHKFYCSLRPQSQNFAEGFNFRAGIQKALETNDVSRKYGLPLIFLNFGEIAFGCDDLEEVFRMYFNVLPAALRDLPWKDHKFSFKQPPVSDFKSIPVSFDVFGSSNLLLMRSDSQTNAFRFNSQGLQPHVPQRVTESNHQDLCEQPSGEALERLSQTIREEFKSEQRTLYSGLCYR
jgi:hypothetical protein